MAKKISIIAVDSGLEYRDDNSKDMAHCEAERGERVSWTCKDGKFNIHFPKSPFSRADFGGAQGAEDEDEVRRDIPTEPKGPKHFPYAVTVSKADGTVIKGPIPEVAAGAPGPPLEDQEIIIDPKG